MKILIACYQMMDLGGIVGDLEALYQGLTTLGHEVEVRQLCWRTTIGSQRIDTTGMIKGSFGLWHDQTGWVWDQVHRIPYKGPENISRWKEFANGFDAVIWHLPVPSQNNENEGNSDWLELYEISPAQIAYVHDGNLHEGYPWVYAIQNRIKAFVATQGAAYGSLAQVPNRSYLVMSGQVDIENRKRMREPRWEDRLPGFYANFTAKGWKHLADLVRAVPHMNAYPKIYAGNGIDLRYMRSPDKCPPKYFASEQYDPDMKPEWKGKKIWDLALEHKLQHRDYVHPQERDNLMSRMRVHIDPSWSKKYARFGGHWNRTTVDSMIVGTIPIARNLGIATNEEGYGDIFNPGVNYFMIPWNTTPKQFADEVRRAICMSTQEYKRYLEEMDLIIDTWDNVKVAERIVKAITGDTKSDLPTQVGGFNETLSLRAEDVCRTFFKVSW